MNNRFDFVKMLLHEKPDMSVIYFNKQINTMWDNAKILSGLNEKETLQFNLRKQLPNEIILDIEEKFKLERIKEQLQEKGWNYEIWETGSRGLHISLKFSNLEDKSIEIRDKIRKYIIDVFRTDDSMSSEKHWIAMEWTPHFKTGNEKTLSETIINDETIEYNLLDPNIIKYCEELVKASKLIQSKPDIDFSDYPQTDPYLRFALENKIERGDRNNILFKNLAIGLVKSGIEDELLQNYIDRIIRNCPGKHSTEFMGWVNKARNGELLDYNKSELNIWAIQNGCPPLYELIKDVEEEESYNIKQLWDTIWNYNIAKQMVWGDLCFYNLIGTLLKETQQDYRIHVIFSSFTTTGKDEGINLVENILKELNYKTSRPAEATDKSLVGGINQIAIDENTKHGVSKDNPVNGKYEFKPEVEFGLLGTVDWLAFGEAESVFKPGAHNQKIQLYMRQAMDKNRTVEKNVGNRQIKLNTNTSILLTTYTMNDKVYSLLHNGLFQRTLYYNRDISDEDHDDILEHMTQMRYNKNIKLNFDEVKYNNLLLEKLKKMKIWYDENRDKFEFFDGCDKHIRRLWAGYKHKYKSLLPLDKKIIDSIVRRASNNLHKLLILHSVWNFKINITKDDVNLCFTLIKNCIESVKGLVLQQKSSEKREYGILQILSNGSLNIGNLKKEMQEQLGMKSPNSQTAEIKKMQQIGYIDVYQDNKFKIAELTKKGRRMAGIYIET